MSTAHLSLMPSVMGLDLQPVSGVHVHRPDEILTQAGFGETVLNGVFCLSPSRNELVFKVSHLSSMT